MTFMRSDFVTAEIYFTMEADQWLLRERGSCRAEIDAATQILGGVRGETRVEGKERRGLWMNVDVEIQLEAARR